MKRRLVVVGSGQHFVSGISYYTSLLAQELSSNNDVSVVLLRRLIPRFLYPGKDRVGSEIMGPDLHHELPTFNGIDWTLVPSLWRALRFVRREAPEVIILQWWSASALPAYLALARHARRNDLTIILELHEDLDTAEARIPIIGPLVKRGLRRLVRQAAANVVHSEFDRERMITTLGLRPDRTFVIPHGPYEMALGGTRVERSGVNTCRILFFGTIRPYKGLEYLVQAFDRLPRENDNWHLTIVGETWEGWTVPFEHLELSPFQQDIEVVNRYVPDAELPDLFANADLVVLPYLRSSASGPLHLTMAAGLPVVLTRVGGLIDATEGYEGAVLVEPADITSLVEGVIAARALVGKRFPDPRSWNETVTLYDQVIEQAIQAGKSSAST